MEIGQVMIITSLAAALALLGPAPETLIRQEVPYSSVASGPVSNEARLLNDQDTALFRQGLTAARARDVSGARNAAALAAAVLRALAGLASTHGPVGVRTPTGSRIRCQFVCGGVHARLARQCLF